MGGLCSATGNSVGKGIEGTRAQRRAEAFGKLLMERTVLMRCIKAAGSFALTFDPPEMGI